MAATFKRMGWEDREVKVRRDELLSVLRENRERHVREFAAACIGYREVALRKLEDSFQEARAVVERLKEGQTVSVVGFRISLSVPVNYEKAYDQIIRMMEMSVDAEIELTASQFACFVMDDWEWKDEWAASIAQYVHTAK
jgi:sugar diacid utilization regulator